MNIFDFRIELYKSQKPSDRVFSGSQNWPSLSRMGSRSLVCSVRCGFAPLKEVIVPRHLPGHWPNVGSYSRPGTYSTGLPLSQGASPPFRSVVGRTGVPRS